MKSALHFLRRAIIAANDITLAVRTCVHVCVRVCGCMSMCVYLKKSCLILLVLLFSQVGTVAGHCIYLSEALTPPESAGGLTVCVHVCGCVCLGGSHPGVKSSAAVQDYSSPRAVLHYNRGVTEDRSTVVKL